MNEIKSIIEKVVTKLFNSSLKIEITRPDYQFGDYSTNIALKLAPEVKVNPRIIAEQICNELSASCSEVISSAQVVNPGFINILLTNKYLVKLLEPRPIPANTDQQIVIEYSDPNPLKILHVGHLYTSVIGDTIANLLALDGNKVHRVNFGGDIGRHVAMNIAVIMQRIENDISNLNKIKEEEQAKFLSECYIEGNRLYQEDQAFQAEVQELNKTIYDIAINNKNDSLLAEVYWTTRKWSYQYFAKFYGLFNIQFEKFYPESSVAKLGVEIIQKNIPNVYRKSEGAVIFDGTMYGLNTYVYINSLGLPTYSGKDVGLIFQKWNDYNFNRSIVITGNEQVGYMKNVLKSVEMINPELASRSTHLTHGMVKLSGGQKMSSREGNVISAEEALEYAKQAALKLNPKTNPKIIIGAIKYAFLKQTYGPDVIYSPQDAVSLEGNSGPYLQYSYARCFNILKKSKVKDYQKLSHSDLEDSERHFIYQISEFNEVLNEAINNLKPHLICGYLYKIAQVFNRFYETNRVIGHDREELRINMLAIYLNNLKQGLTILGIDILEKM